MIVQNEAKWVWQEENSKKMENSISFSDIINIANPIKEEQEDPVLDVHHPDSPYGLIQDVLKPINQPQNDLNDLGGLDSNEVWLSQGDLLVLKGNLQKWRGSFQW